jgi:hypothetical protein
MSDPKNRVDLRRVNVTTKLGRLLSRHRWDAAERQHILSLYAAAGARSPALPTVRPKQPLLIPQDPTEGVAPKQNKRVARKRPPWRKRRPRRDAATQPVTVDPALGSDQA